MRELASVGVGDWQKGKEAVMLYYENMEELPQKASDFLSGDFLAGLEQKDSAKIRDQAAVLPHNVVLEGIGNRMLIRDFLVQTKGELSSYVSTLDVEEVDLEDGTRRLFGVIDGSLDEIFKAADENKDRPGGLGMERFRQEFRNTDDIAVINLADHIAQMDVNKVLAINNPYTVMKAIRGAIVEELWKNVQDYREIGDDLEIRENIRKAVVEFVEAIDRDILNSMMHGDKYAASHTQ